MTIIKAKIMNLNEEKQQAQKLCFKMINKIDKPLERPIKTRKLNTLLIHAIKT